MRNVEKDKAIVLAARLREQAGRLEQTLSERILLEHAKREIAERYGFEPNEAREMIYALARSQRRDLYEFCEEILATRGRFDGMYPPAPLRLQT